MMARPSGDLRGDRQLAPDYLIGLKERSTEEIRAMRADAEQEETDLSYLRRLLQGRADILRAELGRRHGEGPGGSLVDALPQILADERRPSHGLGRHAALDPSDLDADRHYVEALVSEGDVSNPGALDEEMLTRSLEILDREEAEVSHRRRSMQAVMDELTAELGRRYKDGAANVTDLLNADTD